MFCSHESHQGKFTEITAHRQSELNISGLSKSESINSNHNIYLISNPIGSTMVATTTICVEPEVKELLRGLRIHENESYNSVVKRLLKNAYSDEPYTEEDVKDLETALQEIKEGKYYTHEEVWAEIDRERAEKQKEKACMP